MVADLRRLRAESGGVAFAEIAARIRDNRRRKSGSDDATGPARTTIYDAFRPGRSRLDGRLVGEIVEALGVPSEAVPSWVERANRALPSNLSFELEEPKHTPNDPSVGQTADVDAAEATGPADPTATAQQAELLRRSAAPPPSLHSSSSPPSSPPAARRAVSWGVVLGVMAVSILINLSGHYVVAAFRLPLFLDMIGTAITAIAIGPWAGVVVAVVSNAGGVWLSGPPSLFFSLVNVAGALVWGYGARRFRLASTIPRYFLLNVIVAVCCSAVAVPIILLLFHGGTGHAGENVVWTLQLLGQPQGLAVLSSNLVASVTDKLISGFVALVAVACIAQWWSLPSLDGSGRGEGALVDLTRAPFDPAAESPRSSR